ncbi:unnamed protein product [Spirodela intermedia]|uniref:Uncharacterized protein n=1 Tax=Spirodela intermedia TaxID=51605 RepID=A0A7I8KVX8_SPIIN|nr:unnamed protein product [Spirodela intermedia]
MWLAVTRRRGARWGWGACHGMIYSMDSRSFYRESFSNFISNAPRIALTRFSKVPSLACTTTPCPTVGWPPVTWKGSGAHVPLSVQAARALAPATWV